MIESYFQVVEIDEFIKNTSKYSSDVQGVLTYEMDEQIDIWPLSSYDSFFRNWNSVIRITCTRKFFVLNYPWFIFVIWDDLDGIINLNIWTCIIYHWKLGCFGLSLLIQSTKDMDYFGSSDENKKIFDTMPNLKCVSTVSAGYDHLGMVIDEHKWHFHWVDQDASSRCPWFLVGRVLSKFKKRPRTVQDHKHFNLTKTSIIFTKEILE